MILLIKLVKKKNEKHKPYESKKKKNVNVPHKMYIYIK